LGMVTDATWTDFDNDNDLDIIIVGEWMPITIFENDSGKLTKISNKNNGLKATSGWWWSIVAHDYDQDGDEDYVMGNMGMNYKFKPSEGGPLELFSANFDDTKKQEFVFGYYQDGKLYPCANLARAVTQNNTLKRKIPTHQQYANMTLSEIYGQDVLDKAYHLSIQTLQSGYVENLGNGKFEFRPFDNYAQISNINAILPKDVDRDGNLDIVMAGNLYNMEAETIRNDAGVGVWMKGNGSGEFTSVRPHESGLYVDGYVKHIKEVNTPTGKIIIFVKNSDHLQTLEIFRK